MLRPIALGDAGAGAAWEELCVHYWPPVYSYIRRSGVIAHEAEDLTQEFFRHIIVRELPKQADRERGRFRNFLLTALKHFLGNQHTKRVAQKRGGGRIISSLDDAELHAGIMSPMPVKQFRGGESGRR